MSLRVGLAGWLALSALSPSLATAAPGPPGLETRTERVVRYRTNGHVYVDGGELGGLVLGQVLAVVRKGVRIGEIEVVFLSRHSATARIINETAPIVARDLLVPPDMAASRDRSDAGRRLRSAMARSPGSATSREHRSQPAAVTAVATAGSIERDLETLPAGRASPGPARTAFTLRAPSRNRPWARSSGEVSVIWDGFRDGGEAARDVNDVTGRVSLNLRDIGGKPYRARVRMRVRQVDRSIVGSPAIPVSESRNRLYEVSLRHEPADGRFSFVLGRVGVSPFVGLGYLDGGLVQVAVTPAVRVGAFGGSVPAVDGIRFDFARTKYGAFLRFGGGLPARASRISVVLAGVRENYERGTRDYISVETSYSASRWSLFQRAEIDLSLPTEENPDGTTGLSTFSVSASYSLPGRSRLYAAYHTRRDPRPGAVRIDADLLNALFRTSVRAGVSIGVGRSGSVRVGGSVRSQQGTDERTYAGSFGIGRRVGPLWAGATAMYYSGSWARGLVATTRLSGRITRSLRFLAYYNYFSSTRGTQPAHVNHRLGGDLTYELPAGLFLRGGFELGRGVALAGTRAVAEAGFRF